MKGIMMASTKMLLITMVIISLLAGCGGSSDSGGGYSGGGGGGGTNPVTPTGNLTASTSVPTGTAGAVNGTLPGFTMAAQSPTGTTTTTTTDSAGNAGMTLATPGNYLLTLYNPTYPSTVLLDCQTVTSDKSRASTVINSRTTTAALIALRYTQADTGNIAGMEISVLSRIANAGTNVKFEAVRARVERYLAANTTYFNVSTKTITDQALLADVDAARNSITMVIDSYPYYYQTGVPRTITLYVRFNHEVTNVPPQNTSYTVVHQSVSTPDVTYTINSSNYQAYGTWSYADRSIQFALSVAMAGSSKEIYTWSYTSMPTPTDGTPLETNSSGQLNTHIFWTL